MPAPEPLWVLQSRPGKLTSFWNAAIKMPYCWVSWFNMPKFLGYRESHWSMMNPLVMAMGKLGQHHCSCWKNLVMRMDVPPFKNRVVLISQLRWCLYWLVCVTAYNLPCMGNHASHWEGYKIYKRRLWHQRIYNLSTNNNTQGNLWQLLEMHKHEVLQEFREGWDTFELWGLPPRFQPCHGWQMTYWTKC